VTAIAFTVFGNAVPAGSKTTGHTNQGRTFVRDSSGHRGKDWRRNVAQEAGVAMHRRHLLDGPLELHVVFYVPRPKGHYGSGRNAGVVKSAAPAYPTVKPDVTKLLRAVEDACTGVVWRDDAQVVTQHAQKRYGEPARCVVAVAPAPPPPPPPPATPQQLVAAA
jgi:Holliday junction resolvase RusA-like endonuclease